MFIRANAMARSSGARGLLGSVTMTDRDRTERAHVPPAQHTAVIVPCVPPTPRASTDYRTILVACTRVCILASIGALGPAHVSATRAYAIEWTGGVGTPRCMEVSSLSLRSWVSLLLLFALLDDISTTVWRGGQAADPLRRAAALLCACMLSGMADPMPVVLCCMVGACRPSGVTAWAAWLTAWACPLFSMADGVFQWSGKAEVLVATASMFLLLLFGNCYKMLELDVLAELFLMYEMLSTSRGHMLSSCNTQ